MTIKPQHVQLSSDDRAALREFWTLYEPRHPVISERMRAATARLPQWQSHSGALSPAQIADDDLRALHVRRDAFLGDRWEPLIGDLRAVGAMHARAGVSYPALVELMAGFRDIVRSEIPLIRLPTLRAAATASRGMSCVFDIECEEIGDAFLVATQLQRAGGDEHYRAMFEMSPQPMWMFDRETLRFVAVNEAAIRDYGYTRDEFAEMTLADIRPPEDVDALRADVVQAVGLSGPSVWRHRRKNGSIATVEVQANDFPLGGRAVRLALITDITERDTARRALVETEDQLRQAQKMDALGRLAGGVAHDFNNVLTVIKSYACMLEDSFEHGDSRGSDAKEIRRASERAATITRQLLTLSRHGPVAPRAILLDDVIGEFAPMVKRLIGSRVRLVIHRGEVPAVVADPSQIEQVVMNLAVNARDAMPDGGQLTIETFTLAIADAEAAAARGLALGSYVEVAVTDTGTGIDPELQRRIFDPFFTTKPAGGGTGLGLSIAHGIVTQAGGSISVHSQSGHGTTFRIHLPVADTAVVIVPVIEAAPVDRPLPPLTVLVIDEQSAIRSVAGRILMAAGCQVLEAATCEEARRLAVNHEGAIDVAILDTALPDGRSDVLGRQLRDLRPAIQLVHMSGYPVGALGANGAPPEDLLAKPFTPARLRAAVARVALPAEGAAIETVTLKRPGRYRVLLADDEDEFRRAAARVLRRADFEVVDVDSGRRALTAVETGKFDVVVSDVQMPDGTGLDLLRGVRRVDLDVPVILMSGSPDVATASAAVEYGAFRYLTKPLDPGFAEVVRIAARANALARLRRDAFAMGGAHAGVADRAGLEVRFEQAMAGLWLAYQPIVDARTGGLFGVEALLRSTEPSMASPHVVLQAAAQLGRLPNLGREVRRMSAQAVDTRGSNVALFVNLHPEDLADADLIDDKSALAAIAPRVILEVTERAPLDRSPALSERLDRLRSLGFRLAVDDIGAGFSGLASFTELQPEIVKIDLSLVRDVHTSVLKQRTIGALCQLCHEVGTLVVGEGVETIEERDVLVDLGCDLLQGYLIGRPSRQLPA